MFVYVDESGDAGMKLGCGSSTHFVVSLVMLPNEKVVNECNAAIDEFRRSLGWHPAQEFHFNKCSAGIRSGFLRTVLPYEFYCSSFVLDKARVSGPGFQFKDSLYKCTLNYAFQNARADLREARITIDGSGERLFRKQLKTYLRARMKEQDGRSQIKSITLGNSRSNNLLQLADMVVGAVARQFRTERANHMDYWLLISKKHKSFQIWPK